MGPVQLTHESILCVILQAKNAKGIKLCLKKLTWAVKFCIVYSQLRELASNEDILLKLVQCICSFICLFVGEGQEIGCSIG